MMSTFDKKAALTVEMRTEAKPKPKVNGKPKLMSNGSGPAKATIINNSNKNSIKNKSVASTNDMANRMATVIKHQKVKGADELDEQDGYGGYAGHDGEGYGEYGGKYRALVKAVPVSAKQENVKPGTQKPGTQKPVNQKPESQKKVRASKATTAAPASHLAELEERIDDLHNDWETESFYEDVIGSNLEDRFFDDLPWACTTEEALAYRRLLRTVGPVEFISRTVDSGSCSARKLLTAFNVRPPSFLEGSRDECYYPFLTTAITRELKKRAKLERYNTLEDAVELIRSSRNIIVLTGAGISTSLGIPDFRSKDIGLYSRLSHLGLNDPQEVFDIQLFREDPSVFYSVARDILPSGDRCTPTHAFIALLQRRGKLLTNYTQNIDNLEAVAGIDPERLVQCHGSFSTASCIMCGHVVDGPTIFPTIRAGLIPRCPKCAPKARTTANSRKRKLVANLPAPASASSTGGNGGGSNGNGNSNGDGEWREKRRPAPRRSAASASYHPHSRSRDSNSDSEYDLPSRGGILKPDITFFGEQLPTRFGERLMTHDKDLVDLVIVIGTSLKVAPVSEMVPVLPPHIPQIYIGRDAISHTNFDIDLLGDCDHVVAELCRRLGWRLDHEMVDPEERVEVRAERGYFSRFRIVPVPAAAAGVAAVVPAVSVVPVAVRRRKGVVDKRARRGGEEEEEEEQEEVAEQKSYYVEKDAVGIEVVVLD